MARFDQRDESPRSGSAIRPEIYEDSDRASHAAAGWLAGRLDRCPNLLLAAATGESPTLMYRYLVERLGSRAGASRDLRVLKLDEWGGLDMDDPATCEQYIRRHLLDPLALPSQQYVGFDSNPRDPQAECERIAGWLRRHGPIGVCVLGLGPNGHVAMNEPGSDPERGCHVADLEPSTLSHAMLADARRLPTYGLTLGLGDILASDAILLLVFGQAKARPLARLLTGDISVDFPASSLHGAREVLCVADRAAASLLSAQQLESLGAAWP